MQWYLYYYINQADYTDICVVIITKQDCTDICIIIIKQNYTEIIMKDYTDICIL
jgi:hypothetical protein